MDVPLLPVFIKQLSRQTETYVSQEELGRSHSRHPSSLHRADLNFTADGQQEEEEERPSSGRKRFRLQQISWLWFLSHMGLFFAWKGFSFGKSHFPAPGLREGLGCSLSLSPSLIKPASQSPSLISTWVQLARIKSCSHKNTRRSRPRFGARPS